MPGLLTKNYGTGDFRWLLDSTGFRDAITATLDVSTFTAATHYPNGFFPSGLIANIADPKAVKPFTGAAGEKLGFLKGDHPTDGVTDRDAAFLATGIHVKTSKLPVTTNLPTTAPAGMHFTTGA